jgi:hypothetical protein
VLAELAAEPDPAAGAGVFVSAGCWHCHTLAAIPGADGGIDLDELKPSAPTVVNVVTHGIPPIMPPFGDRLTKKQIEDVAAFVVAATAGEPVELLPDLDPVKPDGIAVIRTGAGATRRFLLGFVSATENVGPGPLVIQAHRAADEETMTADQVVDVSDGTARVHENVGTVFYGVEEGHDHWHLRPYLVYELRRVRHFKLVRRGQKIGFCLGDRYRAPLEKDRRLELPSVPGAPVFRGNCGRGEPDLLEVESGISVGYGDPYSAFLMGQSIDVTGLAAGEYYLVHRVNPDRRLLESRYANNVSSALLSIAWPKGKANMPRIRVIASCTASERCAAGRST